MNGNTSRLNFITAEPVIDWPRLWHCQTQHCFIVPEGITCLDYIWSRYKTLLVAKTHKAIVPYFTFKQLSSFYNRLPCAWLSTNRRINNALLSVFHHFSHAKSAHSTLLFVYFLHLTVIFNSSECIYDWSNRELQSHWTKCLWYTLES